MSCKEPGRDYATTAFIQYTALGLSIGAVAAELLGGGLNTILGNRTACAPGERPVSATEAALMAKNAELETEKKLLESNIYTDQKTLELYRYVDGKFAAIDAQINLQKIGIRTFIGMIKHNPQAYKKKIMDDPLFKWLIIETDDGEIEIEGMINGLREAVNKEGMAILDTKMFGKMTFKPSDIEELRRCLTE